MKRSSFLHISLLIVGIWGSSAGAQRCNMSVVPSVPDFSMDLMTQDYWYLQDIIVLHAEDLEESKYRCYIQAVNEQAGAGFYWTNDFWLDAATGEQMGHEAWVTPGPPNFAEWMVTWSGTWLYTGLWVHTDYENYAVQYYCPQLDPYRHKESMLIFTRNPTPDPVTLDLLETIATRYGFPKEHVIRINNTGCPIPDKAAKLMSGLTLGK